MDEISRLDCNEYAYLRRLPIDKLLELLAVAPVHSACPEDEAYVDALEEAIIEKENEDPTGFFPDVDQQWEQFVTQYLPDIEKAALEPERMEHADSEQTNQQSLEVPPKRAVPFSRVWRTALVAAATIVCMFAIMVMAQAAGIDVFGAMARWTKDVFSFGQISPGSVVFEDPGGETGENGAEAPNPEQEFSSLQEALDAYGISEVHEPTWLPDGYALEGLDVTVRNDPFLQAFLATYSDGESGMGIDIMSYEGEPATQVENTDAQVEVVEKNGITFYLIENVKSYTIAWYTQEYEYYISGKVGKDILWEIADSMFE